MTVLLRRVDPERRMSRFYRLHVQPALFGEWSVVTEWGRIGSAGRVHVRFYASRDKAERAGERIVAAKLKKGYRRIT
jgi:predicted DNA-binding WGR domain protein